MISLAARDILRSWSKFLLTVLGLGLLIGVTLSMAGIYRGMVDDAQALLNSSFLTKKSSPPSAASTTSATARRWKKPARAAPSTDPHDSQNCHPSHHRPPRSAHPLARAPKVRFNPLKNKVFSSIDTAWHGTWSGENTNLASLPCPASFRAATRQHTGQAAGLEYFLNLLGAMPAAPLAQLASLLL